MPNITSTSIDVGSIFFDDAEFEDGLLTFAGAGTVLTGAILARDSVSLKFVPFVVGGTTNDDGIPKAVLTYDVTATEAGDVPVRVGIMGSVYRDALIIHADGNGTNVTAAVTDQLRDYGIFAVKNKELNF